MLAKFCKVDGAVSKPEVDLVDSFFQDALNLTHEQRRSAVRLFQTAKDSQVSFSTHVADFAAARPEQAVVHITVDLLMAIAVADGEIAHTEERLLSELVGRLGLSDSSFHEFLREREQRQRAASQRNIDRRTECLSTLGLSDECSQREIKAAFRSLVTQYHPDKVQHLGPKLREVAEQEMKRINEAYSYLSRN